MVNNIDINNLGGLCSVQMKIKIKIEDIILWILVLAIVAIALWLLHGSPPEENALITVALFIAASELLIWKKLFEIDKNTAIGFTKVKEKLNSIENKLK